MYYFTEEYSKSHLFWFRKDWIETGSWAALPKAGKAVLPVICSHLDENGVAFPGLLRIAILAGLSTKQAGEGIKALSGFPGLTIEQRWTKRGKQSKKFTVELPATSGFPFYTSIFHSGIWHFLPSSSKALYPVMRCYGGLSGDDLEYYILINEIDDSEDYKDIFRERKWEFCNESQAFLSSRAGIHRTGFRNAVAEIKDKEMIIPAPDDYIGDGRIITVRPGIYYKRPFMNERISKRYSKSNR